jgi:hypothetical protein
MATPDTAPGTAPSIGVHPEIARFEKEFDRGLIPKDVELSIETNAVSGERPNTDWSRLGFTFGLLFALFIGAGVVVWVPILNVIWGVGMLCLFVALPIFGARAALFRLRRGRVKTFRIEFSEDQARWDSNDEAFWKPVKDFFRV